MVTCNVVSAAKANRLYWLGRYVERVYLSLHLLRRYYDLMIDGAGDGYGEYCRKMGLYNTYPDSELFRLGHMYDTANAASIWSGLKAANDNAIVLREEIRSETLSYVQMALAHISEAAERGETNITNLQPITDYMLAFWGSIDERVFNERIRTLLKLGKLVENIDIHIRFEYSHARIDEAWQSLTDLTAQAHEDLADSHLLESLHTLLDAAHYAPHNEEYKNKALKFINGLVLV